MKPFSVARAIAATVLLPFSVAAQEPQLPLVLTPTAQEAFGAGPVLNPPQHPPFLPPDPPKLDSINRAIQIIKCVLQSAGLSNTETDYYLGMIEAGAIPISEDNSGFNPPGVMMQTEGDAYLVDHDGPDADDRPDIISIFDGFPGNGILVSVGWLSFGGVESWTGLFNPNWTNQDHIEYGDARLAMYLFGELGHQDLATLISKDDASGAAASEAEVHFRAGWFGFSMLIDYPHCGAPGNLKAQNMLMTNIDGLNAIAWDYVAGQS